jgi:hypothetical protein
MNNYDLHVAALERYYQKIGCSEGAALRAAYEDADALREGKSISPEALAAIPDPVRSGLATEISFQNDLEAVLKFKPFLQLDNRQR